MVLGYDKNWEFLFLLRQDQRQNCCHGNSTTGDVLRLFVINISGSKFEKHCNISRYILYLVFYNFSCTTCDVITFLICIIEKRYYL